MKELIIFEMFQKMHVYSEVGVAAYLMLFPRCLCVTLARAALVVLGDEVRRTGLSDRWKAAESATRGAPEVDEGRIAFRRPPLDHRLRRVSRPSPSPVAPRVSSVPIRPTLRLLRSVGCASARRPSMRGAQAGFDAMFTGVFRFRERPAVAHLARQIEEALHVAPGSWFGFAADGDAGRKARKDVGACAAPDRDGPRISMDNIPMDPRPTQIGPGSTRPWPQIDPDPTPNSIPNRPQIDAGCTSDRLRIGPASVPHLTRVNPGLQGLLRVQLKVSFAAVFYSTDLGIGR